MNVQENDIRRSWKEFCIAKNGPEKNTFLDEFLDLVLKIPRNEHLLDKLNFCTPQVISSFLGSHLLLEVKELCDRFYPEDNSSYSSVLNSEFSEDFESRNKSDGKYFLYGEEAKTGSDLSAPEDVTLWKCNEDVTFYKKFLTFDDDSCSLDVEQNSEKSALSEDWIEDLQSLFEISELESNENADLHSGGGVSNLESGSKQNVDDTEIMAKLISFLTTGRGAKTLMVLDQIGAVGSPVGFNVVKILVITFQHLLNEMTSGEETLKSPSGTTAGYTTFLLDSSMTDIAGLIGSENQEAFENSLYKSMSGAKKLSKKYLDSGSGKAKRSLSMTVASGKSMVNDPRPTALCEKELMQIILSTIIKFLLYDSGYSLNQTVFIIRFTLGVLKKFHPFLTICDVVSSGFSNKCKEVFEIVDKFVHPTVKILYASCHHFIKCRSLSKYFAKYKIAEHVHQLSRILFAVYEVVIKSEKNLTSENCKLAVKSCLLDVVTGSFSLLQAVTFIKPGHSLNSDCDAFKFFFSNDFIQMLNNLVAMVMTDPDSAKAIALNLAKTILYLKARKAEQLHKVGCEKPNHACCSATPTSHHFGESGECFLATLSGVLLRIIGSSDSHSVCVYAINMCSRAGICCCMSLCDVLGHLLSKFELRSNETKAFILQLISKIILKDLSGYKLSLCSGICSTCYQCNELPTPDPVAAVKELRWRGFSLYRQYILMNSVGVMVTRHLVKLMEVLKPKIILAIFHNLLHPWMLDVLNIDIVSANNLVRCLLSCFANAQIEYDPRVVSLALQVYEFSEWKVGNERERFGLLCRLVDWEQKFQLGEELAESELTFSDLLIRAIHFEVDVWIGDLDSWTSQHHYEANRISLGPNFAVKGDEASHMRSLHIWESVSELICKSDMFKKFFVMERLHISLLFIVMNVVPRIVSAFNAMLDVRSLFEKKPLNVLMIGKHLLKTFVMILGSRGYDEDSEHHLKEIKSQLLRITCLNCYHMKSLAAVLIHCATESVDNCRESDVVPVDFEDLLETSSVANSDEESTNEGYVADSESGECDEPSVTGDCQTATLLCPELVICSFELIISHHQKFLEYFKDKPMSIDDASANDNQHCKDNGPAPNKGQTSCSAEVVNVLDISPTDLKDEEIMHIAFLFNTLTTIWRICKASEDNCTQLFNLGLLKILVTGFGEVAVSTKCGISSDVVQMVLNIWAEVAKYRLKSADLGLFFGLIKSESSPMDLLLCCLKKVVDFKNSQPHYLVKFPCIPFPVKPIGIGRTSSMSSLSISSYVEVKRPVNAAEEKITYLRNAQLRQGIFSCFSMSAVVCPLSKLDWPMYENDLSVAMWLQLESRGVKISKSQIQPDCLAPPSFLVFQAIHHQSLHMGDHIFSVGSTQLMFSVYVKPNLDKLYLCATRESYLETEVFDEALVHDIGFNDSKWHHLAVAFSGLSFVKGSKMQVTFILDGIKSVTLILKLPFLDKINKRVSCFLLLGYVDRDEVKEDMFRAKDRFASDENYGGGVVGSSWEMTHCLSIGCVFLFRDTILSREQSCGLIALGKNAVSLMISVSNSEKTLFSNLIDINFLNSQMDFSFLYNDVRTLLRPLRESLLLLYSPKDESEYIWYEKFASNVPDPANISYPRGKKLLPAVLFGEVKCSTQDTFTLGLLQIGGASQLAFLIAKIAEFGKSSTILADYLSLTFKVFHSEPILCSQFYAFGGPHLICRLIKSSSIHSKIVMLKAMIDCCLNKSAMKFDLKKNVFTLIHSSPILLVDRGIFEVILANWRCFLEENDYPIEYRCEDMNGSNLSSIGILFGIIDILLEDLNPYRNFNHLQLQDINALQKVVSLFEELKAEGALVCPNDVAAKSVGRLLCGKIPDNLGNRCIVKRLRKESEKTNFAFPEPILKGEHLKLIVELLIFLQPPELTYVSIEESHAFYLPLLMLPERHNSEADDSNLVSLCDGSKELDSKFSKCTLQEMGFRISSYNNKEFCRVEEGEDVMNVDYRLGFTEVFGRINTRGITRKQLKYRANTTHFSRSLPFRNITEESTTRMSREVGEQSFITNSSKPLTSGNLIPSLNLTPKKNFMSSGQKTLQGSRLSKCRAKGLRKRSTRNNLEESESSPESCLDLGLSPSMEAGKSFVTEETPLCGSFTLSGLIWHMLSVIQNAISNSFQIQNDLIFDEIIRLDMCVILGNNPHPSVRAAALRLFRALLLKRHKGELHSNKVMNILYLLAHQLYKYTSVNAELLLESWALALQCEFRSSEMTFDHITPDYYFQPHLFIVLFAVLPYSSSEAVICHRILTTLLKVLVANEELLLKMYYRSHIIDSLLLTLRNFSHIPDDVEDTFFYQNGESKKSYVIRADIIAIIGNFMNTLIVSPAELAFTTCQELLSSMHLFCQNAVQKCGTSCECSINLLHAECAVLEVALVRLAVVSLMYNRPIPQLGLDDIQASFLEAHGAGNITILQKMTRIIQQNFVDQDFNPDGNYSSRYSKYKSPGFQMKEYDRSHVNVPRSNVPSYTIVMPEVVTRFKTILKRAVDFVLVMHGVIDLPETIENFAISLLEFMQIALSTIIKVNSKRDVGNARGWLLLAQLSQEAIRNLFLHLLNYLISPKNSYDIRESALQRLAAHNKLLPCIFQYCATKYPGLMYRFGVFFHEFLYQNDCKEVEEEYNTLITYLEYAGVPILPRPEGIIGEWSVVNDEKMAWTEEINSIADAATDKSLSLYLRNRSVFELVCSEGHSITQKAIQMQDHIRKRALKKIKLAKCRNVRFGRGWFDMAEALTHEKATWYFPQSYPRNWELDVTEGPVRIRKRMRKCKLNIPNKFFTTRMPPLKGSAHLQELLFDKEMESSLSHIIESISTDENLIHTCHASFIAPTVEQSGEFLISLVKLYFIGEEAASQMMGSVPNVISKCWPVETILEFHLRRYRLKDCALELFSANGQSAFLSFQNEERRSEVLVQLRKLHFPNLKMKTDLQDLTLLWRDGTLTNFEYLTHLNKLAGRSFNDLMQYPVFPFILQDYSSPQMDIEDPKIYRNLGKPIPVQSKERERRFTRNYEVMLNFPDGSFDVPDRCFHTLATTWQLAASDSTTAIRELIPEFFFLPEMFLNTQGFNFGVRQNNEVVNDVKLPEWCKLDPRRFILVHRAMLESSHVTRNLRHWIDLVFGYKQTGKAAVESMNVFHPATYFGFDVEKGSDEIAVEARKTMIKTYGQTPRRLFAHPHQGPYANIICSSQENAREVLEGITGIRWGVYALSPADPKPVLVNSVWLLDKYVYIEPLKNNEMYILQKNTVIYIYQPINEAPVVYTITWGYNDGVIRSRRSPHNHYYPLIYHPPYNQVTCCSINSNRLWAGTKCGQVMVYVLGCAEGKLELAANPLNHPLLAHEEAVSCITMSQEFKVCLTGGKDGLVVLWDTNRVSYIRSVSLPGSCIEHLSVSETLGDWVAVASCGDVSSLMNYYTINTQLIGAVVTEARIKSVSFSNAPEGRNVNVIAACLADSTIRLYSTWDLSEVRKMDISSNAKGPGICLRYSTNSMSLCLITENQLLLVWNTSQKKCKGPKFTYNREKEPSKC